MSRPASPIIARVSVEDSQTESINPIDSIPTHKDLADNTPSVQSSVESVNRDIDETLRQMDEEIASLSSKSHKDISINLYASNGFSYL